MVHETSAPRTLDAGPDRGSNEQDSAADPRGRGPRYAMCRTRLLSVVVLNPAQAALVAVQGSTPPTWSHDQRDPPGRPSLWTVALTPFGDVEVARAPAGEGTPVTGSSAAGPGTPVGSRPIRGPSSWCCCAGSRAAADGSRAGCPCSRARCGVVGPGPGARQRLSGQLAALVGAFTHIAPSVAAPAAAPLLAEIAAPSAPGCARAFPAGPPIVARASPGHRRARTTGWRWSSSC